MERTKQGNTKALLVFLAAFVAAFELVAIILILLVYAFGGDDLFDTIPEAVIFLLAIIPGVVFFLKHLVVVETNHCVQLTILGTREEVPDIDDWWYDVVLCGEGLAPTSPFTGWKEFATGIQIEDIGSDSSRFEVQIDTKGDGAKESMIIVDFSTTLTWRALDVRILDLQDKSQITSFIAKRVTTACRDATTKWCQSTAPTPGGEDIDLTQINKYASKISEACLKELREVGDNPEYFRSLGVHIETFKIRKIELPADQRQAKERLQREKSQRTSMAEEADGVVERVKKLKGENVPGWLAAIIDLGSRMVNAHEDRDSSGKGGK
jgi:hypothetical protein